MATYVYYEGCGYESEPFEAATDDAAIEHVEGTFRSAGNPDFDGDEGGILRIELADGEEDRLGVCEFAGENMLPDLAGERGSYRGV
ncbi:hypothetical protein [Micromonospora sp. CPCC 206061]|uniref:hypothetical protein n=1 Tax=Micromonospora sp. CPCC 206061 TaxID=3122410 RepID=UPI002FF05EE3